MPAVAVPTRAVNPSFFAIFIIISEVVSFSKTFCRKFFTPVAIDGKWVAIVSPKLINLGLIVSNIARALLNKPSDAPLPADGGVGGVEGVPNNLLPTAVITLFTPRSIATSPADGSSPVL